MKRRDFCKNASCGLAGVLTIPLASEALAAAGGQAGRRRYKMEVEIFETHENSRCHKKGEMFQYPQDMGKICPWFLASMWQVIRLLEAGVNLPWLYKGTPYEKVIDPEGITTEYIRCPDPTAAVVAKIIRTRSG